LIAPLIKLFSLTLTVIITLISNHFSASVNNRNASIVLFYKYAKFVRTYIFKVSPVTEW